jgi:hypothetical protein
MLLAPRHQLQLPQTGGSRLTYQRLRRPTRLPSMNGQSALSRYLDRLSWLFGGR